MLAGLAVTLTTIHGSKPLLLLTTLASKFGRHSYNITGIRNKFTGNGGNELGGRETVDYTNVTVAIAETHCMHVNVHVQCKCIRLDIRIMIPKEN